MLYESTVHKPSHMFDDIDTGRIYMQKIMENFQPRIFGELLADGLHV